MTHNSEFTTKPPCCILLVAYVEDLVSWEFCETLEERDHILNDLLGDPKKGYAWDEYYPEKYEDVYVVDADEVVIVKKTLAECVAVALKSTEDQCLARYVDSVNNGKDLHNTTFNDYVYDFKKSLFEEFDSPAFAKPSLKNYVDQT